MSTDEYRLHDATVAVGTRRNLQAFQGPEVEISGRELRLSLR
jgi:hypothetical protein